MPLGDLMDYVEENYPICDYDIYGAFYLPKEIQAEVTDPVGKIHRGFIKDKIWYIYLMDYDFVDRCYASTKKYIENNYKIIEKKEFENGAIFIKFKT